MFNIIKSTLLFFPFFILVTCGKKVPQEKTIQTFFVGGYTSEKMNGEGSGISTCTVNTETGEMKLLHVFEKAINPSYLAVHPNGKYLYAANEIGGEKPGYASAYKILENGQLEFLNEKYTGGDYPCHISISEDNKYVLAANYASGNVTLFPLMDDGGLDKKSSSIKHSGSGPFEERQEAPHAHYFGTALNDSSAFAVDLGTDQIIHYRIRKNGKLGIKSVTKTSAGTGPRHIVFHPTIKSCYVITEFNNKIEVFKYYSEYKPFEKFQVISTLEKELPFYSATSSAIKIHPSGHFLYAANRGIPDAEEDNLAIYTIDQPGGRLTFLGNIGTKGKVPRDFEIDPTGKILIAANQETGNLVSFKINNETGELTPTGFELEIKSGTCVKFL